MQTQIVMVIPGTAGLPFTTAGSDRTGFSFLFCRCGRQHHPSEEKQLLSL